MKIPTERHDEFFGYCNEALLDCGFKEASDVERYAVRRYNGCTPQLAEVLTRKKFPGIKTDATFMEGRYTGDASFSHPLMAAFYHKKAEESGVSTSGKFYSKALARFPGDPEAWIDSRADVLRIAKERGWNVNGYVNYEAPDTGPLEDIPVAKDILDREVAIEHEFNPDDRVEDVRDRVFNRLTGRDSSPEPVFSDLHEEALVESE